MVSVFRRTAHSFGSVSQQEISARKPLAIQVVRPLRDDTVQKMAARMRVRTNWPVSLFRALNGLDSQERLDSSKAYKIIK